MALELGVAPILLRNLLPGAVPHLPVVLDSPHVRKVRMTERSGEAAGFDPRFDPAFQPGYRPPAVEPGRFDALRAALTGQAARAAPSPGSNPPADASGTAVDPGSAGTDRTVGADRPDAGDAAAAAPESAAEPQRRNPFVLVLWVIGALFTLTGIGAMRWSFALTEGLQTSTTASQADFQLSYMVQQSAPLLIVLGLAVATSTVFLHALIWNKRNAA